MSEAEQNQKEYRESSHAPGVCSVNSSHARNEEPFTYSLDDAEQERRETVAKTNSIHRDKFAQFLTPLQTARLAASFFSDNQKNQPLHCLDLGAGTGILSVALYERYGQEITIDAVEIDRQMADICLKELAKCKLPHRIYQVDALCHDFEGVYDRVIMNPPYKKMSASDHRQAFLPLVSPNLYTAFMMKGVESLAEGGELVAIIPRSWMNGLYFSSFRDWLFKRVSLDRMHVYESRAEVFSDTDVLQETMIVKLTRSKQSETITVSYSKGKDDPIKEFNYSSVDLIDYRNNCVVNVESVPETFSDKLSSLKERGLCASTGKVVDFRNKEFLSSDFAKGCKRLIYACNFLNPDFPLAGFIGKQVVFTK